MIRSISLLGACAISFAILGACGSEKKDPLWPLDGQPVCEGVDIVPLSGAHPMVISDLEIGDLEDGYDLDLDGEPDNKLAAVGSLARSAIEDSFEDFSIIIPIEFFDFDTVGDDECVKFAIYLGQYRLDGDEDGDDTADPDGDCDDTDDTIKKGAAEVAGDFKDNDCDGLADETETQGDGGIEVVPSDDVMDRDSDGVTIAAGDCNDMNDAIAAGKEEICGDGLDNDCDGNADYAEDVDGNPLCTPYSEPPVAGTVFDPLAFDANGKPLIAFTSGTVTNEGGTFKLAAGPAVFSVNIPVTNDLNLDLRITGARIEGDLVMGPNGLSLQNARLGGVIDANTADKITGLSVEEIGLTEDDTLLDATFANILGPILALPTVPDDSEFAGCRTPDIDVDQDGLEAFCDSNLTDDIAKVDVCIDGDGTIFRDEGTVNCTEAKNDDGTYKFVDGISVEINFNTVPALLPATLPAL